MTATEADIIECQESVDSIMARHNISQQSSKLVSGISIALENAQRQKSKGDEENAYGCIEVAFRICNASLQHEWDNTDAKTELATDFVPRLNKLRDAYENETEPMNYL